MRHSDGGFVEEQKSLTRESRFLSVELHLDLKLDLT